MTARTSVSIAVAIAFVGASLLSVTLALSGTLATPIANADDPLAPIVVGVTTYRSKTPCPRLTYNPILEDPRRNTRDPRIHRMANPATTTVGGRPTSAPVIPC